MLLSLLVYGYASGTFSSRKIERATYDSLAFRYLAAGSHPDHDALASFRRRFLDELADIFLQVRVAGGGFEQCYNAQAAVDTDTLLVVAQGLTQSGNDKQQVVPMLAVLKALPASLGQVQALLGAVATAAKATSPPAKRPKSTHTWWWRAKTTTPVGGRASRNRHRSTPLPRPSRHAP